MTSAADEAPPRPLILIILAASVILAGRETLLVMGNQPLGFDLLPLWTAACYAFKHPDQIYDFATITRLQAWIIGVHTGPRPWIYPPSALLALAPFGQAPWLIAYPAWVAATLGALCVIVMKRLEGPKWMGLALLILAEPSVLAILVGQVTFLIGALVLGGLLALRTRPALAGVLLGCAALIKPTSLLMLPIGLLASRQWRAILWTGVTGIVGAGLAALIFGWRTWFAWLAALPKFDAVITSDPTLWRGTITPTWLLHLAGLDGTPALIIRGALALAGALLTWRVFRATDNAPARMTVMIGASLLITPYAMFYDAAALAPAAVILLMGPREGRRWVWALACYGLAVLAAFPPVSPIALAALMGVTALPFLRPVATAPA